MTRVEKHHVAFPRNLWTSSDDLIKIRRVNELVVPLNPETHDLLHRNVGIVPAPEHHMAKRIVKEFYPARNNPMMTVDALIYAIQEARDNLHTQYLERQLGNLIIESLEMQKYFIGMDYGDFGGEAA